MKIDITLKITPKMVKDAQGNEKKALVGHLGTHFDVMDKEFPLDYTERKAVVFDVSHVKDREIDISDIAIDQVEKEMFVAFYTGFIETVGYGTKEYFSKHPQLSNELLEELLKRNISMIGIDFTGVRRGKEHTPMDQHCANHDVFIIENLCHLQAVLENNDHFIAHTSQMNYTNITGLPCRVIAEIKS